MKLQQLNLSRRFSTNFPSLRPRGNNLDRRQQKFGIYNLLVPNSLKLGVEEIVVDQLIPSFIQKPEYAYTKQPKPWTEVVHQKNREDLEKMARAGNLARKALDLAQSLCQPGTSTLEVDTKVRQFLVENNAYPSPLNYQGFPKSICTSINNVICHGIPNHRKIEPTDIINVDITVFVDGVHGDTSRTFVMPEVDEKGRQLVQVTQQCLELALHICKPGVPLYKIGDVISGHAEKHGYSVSSELTGHSIGYNFHEFPLIFHHRNRDGGVMLEGMTFTIEPILCQGSPTGHMWPDNWTIVTEDGGRSAQFEHTIAITQDGYRILT